jgi:hypothetical protein
MAHWFSVPSVHENRAMARKRKISCDPKTQIGSLPQVTLVSVLGLALLAGCVSPRQIQKTRDDAAVYGDQQRAREVREHCIDSGSMPGTTAYLECRLKSK